jgi:hypothetical protein
MDIFQLKKHLKNKLLVNSCFNVEIESRMKDINYNFRFFAWISIEIFNVYITSTLILNLF